MAGDWIPWNKGLARKLKVRRIAAATGLHRLAVAALLMEFWEWADDETEDGRLPGMTLDMLSASQADTNGAFWSAVVDVGWLKVADDGSLVIPNATRWFGRTAKRRLKDAERNRYNRVKGVMPTPVSRNGDDVRPLVMRTKSGPEEQRVTESLKDPPKPPKGGSADASFDTFWKAYPRKTAKAAALRAWRKLSPDAALLAVLLAALERHKATRQWREGVYPHPATWLNGRRWEDEVGPPPDARTHDDVLRSQEQRRRRHADEVAQAVPFAELAARLKGKE